MRNCEECGKPFESPIANRKFCCTKCGDRKYYREHRETRLKRQKELREARIQAMNGNIMEVQNDNNTKKL